MKRCQSVDEALDWLETQPGLDADRPVLTAHARLIVREAAHALGRVDPEIGEWVLAEALPFSAAAEDPLVITDLTRPTSPALAEPGRAMIVARTLWCDNSRCLQFVRRLPGSEEFESSLRGVPSAALAPALRVREVLLTADERRRAAYAAWRTFLDEATFYPE